MIRWRSQLIRLSVVIAVVVAARYALGPLAKHTASRMIWAGTDARVQIGKSTVGLFPPIIRFDQVTVTRADDSAQAQSIAKLDSIEMEVDAEALLHRRYVIRSGRIDGLELTDIPLSLEPATADNLGIPNPSDQCFDDFLSQLAATSHVNLEGAAQSLELTKRADQIRRRWKSEYTMLRQQAETLQASLDKASTSAQGLNNPLRDRDRVESALAKSKQVQTDLAAVRRAIDEMPNQIQQDMLTLQQAKQVDQNQLANGLLQQARVNEPEAARLVASNINAQVDRLHDYLNWCRSLATQPLAQTTALDRGQTIDLDHGQRGPEWVVQRCDVSGKLFCNQKPVSLTGLIENLASDAGTRSAPFRARLKLQGEQCLRLDYSRDDSTSDVREQLTLHWPEADASHWLLGNAESMAIAVQGGKMEVWAQLESVGEQISGRVISRRSGTGLEVGSSHALATTWVRPLQQTLSAVNHVDVDASFTGTWSATSYEITTNLSALLKSAMDQAMAAQADASRDQLSAKLDELYQREMEGLQASLAAEQTQTRDLVAKADEKAQALSESLLGDANTAEAYLGRLRAGSLR